MNNAINIQYTFTLILNFKENNAVDIWKNGFAKDIL
jgi:hypothetical protein